MLHKYAAIYDVCRCIDHFLTRQLFVSNDIQTFVCILLTVAVNYKKSLSIMRNLTFSILRIITLYEQIFNYLGVANNTIVLKYNEA